MACLVLKVFQSCLTRFLTLAYEPMTITEGLEQLIVGTWLLSVFTISPVAIDIHLERGCTQILYVLP